MINGISRKFEKKILKLFKKYFHRLKCELMCDLAKEKISVSLLKVVLVISAAPAETQTGQGDLCWLTTSGSH